MLADAPARCPAVSWEKARIPGVLQRLGATYFVVAVTFQCREPRFEPWLGN